MNIHSLLDHPMARTPANVQPGQISERIIAAALQLFTQRGYFSTSVPDMARTAQVSVGSIYHHFKDKEDVARALFVGLMEGLQEGLAKIAHDNATAHDRCRAVMVMLFELTESNRDAMDFMLYAKHRDFLPSERPVCSSKPFETMRAFVQDGMPPMKPWCVKTWPRRGCRTTSTKFSRL